ncbi:MAG: NifX-associated nitrogen fixation protein [Xanthobacteraceae bacterium]
MVVTLNEDGFKPPPQVLTPADEQALTTPFVQALVRLVRSHDTFGAYAKRSDARMLADYIVTKEQRRAAAAQCGADPDLVWRIEQYYGAIGLMIEQETGLIASPMLKIYDEGFGRVILITGKLVVLTKHLRDAQRFGFETFAALAAEASKQIAAAVATIQQFPEAARA